jgi:hypothetical protein
MILRARAVWIWGLRTPCKWCMLPPTIKATFSWPWSWTRYSRCCVGSWSHSAKQASVRVPRVCDYPQLMNPQIPIPVTSSAGRIEGPDIGATQMITSSTHLRRMLSIGETVYSYEAFNNGSLATRECCSPQETYGSTDGQYDPRVTIRWSEVR